MIYRILIPLWRPATDNELLSVHWRVKHKRKSADKQMVAVYARLANVPPALGKRRVSLEIVLTGRQKEADPLAYAKSLLDALVACRALIDDASQFVEWGETSYKKGSDPSTTIVLEDLDS